MSAFPFEGELIPRVGSPVVVLWDAASPPPTTGADAELLHRLLGEWLIGYGSVNTRIAYARDVRHWFGFCHDSNLDPLTARRKHVDAWLRLLEARGYAPTSRARFLGAVSAFYTWAVHEEHTLRNPVLGVKRPVCEPDLVRQGGLTMDQARDLLRAAARSVHPHAPRDAVAIHLMLLNGLRVGSVIGANHEDLGQIRGQRGITVTVKGGSRQFHPLPPVTLDLLDKHTAWAQTAPWVRAGVIVHRDQTVRSSKRPLFTMFESGRRATASSIATALTRIAHTAGLPAEVADNITPHWLRHTFVTLALDMDVALRDVQDAAGHASANTTRRYDQNRKSIERHAMWSLVDGLDAAPAGAARSIIIGGTDVTDHIARLVADAPPLTDAQRDQLRVLLAPDGPFGEALNLRPRQPK